MLYSSGKTSSYASLRLLQKDRVLCTTYKLECAFDLISFSEITVLGIILLAGSCCFLLAMSVVAVQPPSATTGTSVNKIFIVLNRRGCVPIRRYM